MDFCLLVANWFSLSDLYLSPPHSIVVGVPPFKLLSTSDKRN